MIKVNETDYIVGLWMVKRFGLGKVYVYATKYENKDEWTIHKKYMYDNQSYNIYMNDNDYKNNCLYKDKSEVDIIKLCNEIANELAVLFNHEQEKVLIGGDISKYNYLALRNKWFPNLLIAPPPKEKKKKD